MNTTGTTLKRMQVTLTQTVNERLLIGITHILVSIQIYTHSYQAQFVGSHPGYGKLEDKDGSIDS